MQTLIIFEVFGETPETRDFSPAAFILDLDGESIYTYSKEFPESIFPRPDMDENSLFDHLDDMKKQGFTLRKKTIDLFDKETET